ncbi:TraR/DksA family transcriptional regulator [Aquicoccus porphyridii]|uniref:TraR/DksA family transcriptional regulator n=1 Tax=Aquicoccus porphyridii TaxID=1852029 RepID=A0A5A9ZT26_9RHOB|nr:TraR/DksA C4-type zinc finger protein [Aquicoccus porphyridii]KAA0920503.1 TraR/DksA family transcriptional regulator [Aquicoccus porphyridii]RAI55043.1 TraR/DksA family transcriptional regulator [Rhodobacteraceae bacterium AsT-22]
MDDREIARFRALIEAQLAGLEEENALGREGQGVVMLDQQSVGRLSRMDALQNQAMAKATQVRRDALGRRLRAALKRIAEDEFGYCEDCGDEIALKRLELDPGVTRCISCASG